MKLLLFSDLHCDADAAQQLVEQSHQADVVIGAGDFATMRRNIDVTIGRLQEISRPTVVVPGNSESIEELKEACRMWPSARVLHGNGVQIDGVPFFGLGGAVPITPFGSWSYDFTEQQAAELLADCPDEGVLVTHSPPLGAVDASSRGKGLGSTTVRESIEQRKLQLVVCGHIHESAGKSAMIGSTTVINAGPVGVLWTLHDRV